MPPKKPLPPALLLALMVFIASLFLQFALMDYLLTLTHDQYFTELRHLQIQITQDLAGQLSRAQASNDDLAALASLRSARANHPQIVEAMIFDNAGKVLLHSDPGMTGKKINVPLGPRLATPVIRHPRESGRQRMSVTVPLPDRDEGYFRADFDEARFARESRAVSVRFVILMFVTSGALGGLCWLRLRRYELVDPLAKVHLEKNAAPSTPAHALGRLAELLLAEMPHAALAVDRDNKILAANPLAWELLNSRKEELIGLHVLASPLPAALTDFYLEAAKHPGRLSETKVALTPKAPSIKARAVFAPAETAWELALLSLQ